MRFNEFGDREPSVQLYQYKCRHHCIQLLVIMYCTSGMVDSTCWCMHAKSRKFFPIIFSRLKGHLHTFHFPTTAFHFHPIFLSTLHCVQTHSYPDDSTIAQPSNSGVTVYYTDTPMMVKFYQGSCLGWLNSSHASGLAAGVAVDEIATHNFHNS